VASSLVSSTLGTAQLPAVMKTGVVTFVSATTLMVLVGSTVVESAYIASYAAPAVGDAVVIFRQDATWCTFGKLAGVGPNLVLNPSFEQGGAQPNVPPSWFLYNESGTSTVSVIDPDAAPPEGTYVAQINPTNSARTAVLYSSPFPALPGQTFALSAFAGGVAFGTGDLTLRALCFANSTDLMPTTSANVVAATVNDIAVPPPYTSISGTALVPAGTTTYMRLGLRAVLATDVGMTFDFAIARRIG